MPVFEQTVTEGITSETQTFISPPRSRAALRKDKKAVRAFVEAQTRLGTFDGRVAHLEGLCQRTAGVREGRRPSAPDFGSRAWYAKDILVAIRLVREALARNEWQLAASEAVLVGALATEAEAKFRWGDLLLGRARVLKNRELSQRSADARHANATERDREIIVARRLYRAKRPTGSTRALALWIAHQLDMPFGTVRDRLRTIGLR